METLNKWFFGVGWYNMSKYYKLKMTKLILFYKQPIDGYQDLIIHHLRFSFKKVLLLMHPLL